MRLIINHLASWLLKKIKLKTRAHPFLRDLRKTNPRTPSLLRQSGSSWTDCQLDALDLSSVVVSIVLYSLWLQKSKVAKLSIVSARGKSPSPNYRKCPLVQDMTRDDKST